MSSMLPPPLKPGDGLSLAYMNKARDVGGSGRLKVDPRTGLELITTPFGAFLRSVAAAEGWYLVTASLGSGQYTLLRQYEAASGGWTSGTASVSAFESNLSTTVPAASTVRVWARRGRGAWRFTYGACS